MGELKSKLIIAEVGKQEYGDEDNKLLHERYTIDKDSWPVYKLFPAGGGDPIDGPVHTPTQPQPQRHTTIPISPTIPRGYRRRPRDLRTIRKRVKMMNFVSNRGILYLKRGILYLK